MSTEEMPDDISGPDPDAPTAKLNAAFETFEQDVKDAKNAGTAMKLCLDAAACFAEIQTKASDDDEDRIQSMAKAYLNQLSDTKSGVARKNVRAHWQDKLNELETKRKLEEGEAVSFNNLLRNTLTGVTKKVTEDKSSNEETSYQLEFSDAEGDDADGTEITVTQSTLFDSRGLWQAYTSAQEGRYPDRIETEEVDWDNLMANLLEDIGEEVEYETGARTAAFMALENYVKNATAYGNHEDAVENGGVYVDAEPKAHDEVLVPREAIASITNTHELTDRALQEEISARGLTGSSTGGNKVSMSTTLNGNWQTFWSLDGEYFNDVGAYKEKAEDPLDRMGPAPGDGDGSDDDDQNSASPDGNDGDSGDNDDDDEVVNESDNSSEVANPDTDDGSEEDRSPGKIGSYGTENGGDE